MPTTPPPPVAITRPTGGPPELLRHFQWDGDGVRVTGDISSTPTGLSVSRIEVRPVGGAVLTHRHLHTVPLGTILAAARADLADQRPARTATPPPGRVPMTDDLLRQVALAYLEETGPGKDRAVLDRMAERFQRPRGTIRTWISRARDAGWLGPAVRGRMGAEPGPRLLTESGQETPTERDAREQLLYEQAQQAGERYEELRTEHGGRLLGGGARGQ